jgi:Tfp pilus assembly protein PilF
MSKFSWIARHALLCGILVGGAACSTTGTNKGRIVSNSERADLYLESAQAAFRDGDLPATFQALNQAEELKPKNVEIHHLRALAFYARQELKNAEAAIRRALDLQPKASNLKTTLGRVLLDLGRDREAIPVLEEAGKDPVYGEAYKPLTSLGIHYYRLNQLKEAKREFDRAIQLQPQFACLAYYYRGHLDLKEGKTTEALVNYTQATKSFCGGFADAHYAIGLVYQRTKQYSLARQKFLEVRQLFPNSALAAQALDQLKVIP